jgi:plasmid stabilization system protein ParE
LYQYNFYSKTNKGHYIDGLINYLDIISKFPYIGKNVYNIKRNKIRQVIYNKHKIMYMIKNNKIYILRIIYFSRKFNFKTFFLD